MWNRKSILVLKIDIVLVLQQSKKLNNICWNQKKKEEKYQSS